MTATTTPEQSKFPKLTLIMAFFIPILIMIIIFIGKEIFPFGNSSFLRTDLYHQYAPFFQEFHDKLTGGESLLYSWNIGGGTNFSALYAYYLASPLNWLVALVPSAYVIEFITYMIVLKIGLCGITFTWYLMKHCRASQFSMCFFGIAYALSGYLAAYSWNIMWLDCILLLPLIVLGLECLVHEGKGFLYCITLGVSILSNYYISIMTCIFLVLYFIVLVLTQENMTFRRICRQIGQFALFSLLAGGIAACVLIPEVYALSTTASSDSTFPKDVSSYFSILQMLARHLPLVEVETGLEHWPNLFSGVAILLLLPLYAMNRKYSYKEKIGYLALCFFFLASFSLNVLNFIWHGLHYPNSLPCRQSFLYTFLILVMSYKGCQGIPERSSRQIQTAFWIAVGFIVAVEAICQEEVITWYVIWVSLLLVGLYALLIYQNRRKRVDQILIALLALMLLVVEQTANTAVTSVTTVNRNTYTDIDTVSAELLKQAAEKEGDDFYRVEKVAYRTKNDGAWLDYPSASTFSSMSYESVKDFYKNMGLEGSTNAFSTQGATPFMYSFLGIRYLLSAEELPESTLYTQVASGQYAAGSADPEKTLYLYENLYTLPLGFVIDGSMSLWECSASTPFSEQKGFVEDATGITDSMFQLLITDSSSSKQATVTVEEPGVVYLYTSGTAKEVSVLHGAYSKTFSNVNRGYLLNVGYCEAGETITVTSTDSEKTVGVTAAIFQEDVFIEAYERLSKEPMTVESYSSDQITASLKTEGGLLVTTIPYDTGWRLKVDGITVQPSCFADTYLCFSIGAGTHSIELSYTPNGLKTGVMITLASLVMLLTVFLITKLWQHFRPAFEKLDDEWKPAKIYEEEPVTEDGSDIRKPAKICKEEPVTRTDDDIQIVIIDTPDEPLS